MLSNKKGNKGPRPKIKNIDSALEAIFEALDTGTKLDYLEKIIIFQELLIIVTLKS